MKIYIVIAALITGFILDSEMKINLSENPEEVKRSILKVIPPGSDINRAKIIMEKNGFKCSFVKDSSFADKNSIYQHIDFLYCDIEKGFIVGRRWQVAVVVKNSLVSEIFVSTGLTGP